VPDRLEDGTRQGFERWLEGQARLRAGIRPQELRQGVRALSALYVERRAGGGLARRARDGAAKRAALALYFAPLHFLATWHALRELGAPRGGVRRIVDLGCGTGATGAAAACWLGAPPLLGVDRSGGALGEARETWAAFGLRARGLRRSLPEGLPRLRRGDLAVLGWCLNELAQPERERLLAALARAGDAGAGLLVLEPLSTRVAPWWPALVRASGRRARELELRVEVERPPAVAALDRAAGLDHRRLLARALLLPPRPGGPDREGEFASAKRAQRAEGERRRVAPGRPGAGTR
jgi:SAM-dependent methyltransferase